MKKECSQLKSKLKLQRKNGTDLTGKIYVFIQQKHTITSQWAWKNICYQYGMVNIPNIKKCLCQKVKKNISSPWKWTRHMKRYFTWEGMQSSQLQKPLFPLLASSTRRARAPPPPRIPCDAWMSCSPILTLSAWRQHSPRLRAQCPQSQACVATSASDQPATAWRSPYPPAWVWLIY